MDDDPGTIIGAAVVVKRGCETIIGLCGCRMLEVATPPPGIVLPPGTIGFGGRNMLATPPPGIVLPPGKIPPGIPPGMPPPSG